MSSALLSTRNLPAVVDQSIPEVGKSCSTNSQKGKHKQRRYVQPPDKGWGWVVVLAALGCSAIVDGLIFSFSSLFGILLDDARISFPVIIATVAAQIFSYLFIGPIINRFLRQNSCRHFVCFGTLFAVSGYLATLVIIDKLSPQFYSLIILTLGVTVGCGLGCIYISSICAVSCYFVRHRIAATTIALSGSGIGMTVFPLMIANWTKNLDIYTALYVYAGIALQALFLGLLIWPLTELPPGCDPMAGKLPREKDMFDYLRERMGYKTNCNESDISLHRLQERFKEAQIIKQKRQLRLRMESECPSVSRMDSRFENSAQESPVPPPDANSPFKDFLNRHLKRGLSKNSDGTSPTPDNSNPGTPPVNKKVTANSACFLSNGADVQTTIPRTSVQSEPSARRQLTVPDKVFSVDSSSQPASWELTSVAGGISTVENISGNDLGHRLDECSDVSEFILVIGAETQQEASKENAVKGSTRYKSVSECVQQINGNYQNNLISGETDIVPPSTQSPDENSQSYVAEDNWRDNTEFDADSAITGFTIGEIGQAYSPITKTQAENINEKMDPMLRIDSDITELPYLDPTSKRLYRRQSSNSSGRVRSMRSRSVKKTGGNAEITINTSLPNHPNKDNNQNLLQMLFMEQGAMDGTSSQADSQGDMSIMEDDVSVTKSNLSVKSPSAVVVKTNMATQNKSQNVTYKKVAVPAYVTKQLPMLQKLVDVRLFMLGVDFPLFCIANALTMAGLFIPLIYFPLRVIWVLGCRPVIISGTSATVIFQLMQTSRLKASVLVACSGTVGCVSRLGVVIGTEFHRFNPLMVTAVALFFETLAIYIVSATEDFVLMAVGIAMIAVCTEIFVSMTTSIIRLSFEPDDGIHEGCDPSLVNPAFAFLTSIRAFAALIGILVSGYIFALYDSTGSCFHVLPFDPLKNAVPMPSNVKKCYDAFSVVTYFSGGMLGLAFIVLIVIFTHKYVKKTIQKRKQKASDASSLLIKQSEMGEVVEVPSHEPIPN